MASNMPPMQPPMPPPGGQQFPSPVDPYPPKKKSSPWLWILGGCLGLVVLGGLIIAGLGVWGYQKVKSSGELDLMKRNPAAAVAKIAIKNNPNLEFVSMDEDKGIMTVRDKKTGKTVTMNFEDIKNGRVSFEGEDGEKVAFGAGSAVTLPGWFPKYPGSTPEGSVSASDANQDAAQFGFKTSDSPAKVLAFYESELKQAGLQVTTLKQDTGGMITGQDEGQGREASVTVSADGPGAQVTATFKSKK